MCELEYVEPGTDGESVLASQGGVQQCRPGKMGSVGCHIPSGAENYNFIGRNEAFENRQIIPQIKQLICVVRLSYNYLRISLKMNINRDKAIFIFNVNPKFTMKTRADYCYQSSAQANKILIEHSMYCKYLLSRLAGSFEITISNIYTCQNLINLCTLLHLLYKLLSFDLVYNKQFKNTEYYFYFFFVMLSIYFHFSSTHLPFYPPENPSLHGTYLNSL